MTEHEDGMWCWCRPEAHDTRRLVYIMHRDIDPSVLACRYMHGGEPTYYGNEGLMAPPWVDGEPGDRL